MTKRTDIIKSKGLRTGPTNVAASSRSNPEREATKEKTSQDVASGDGRSSEG